MPNKNNFYYFCVDCVYIPINTVMIFFWQVSWIFVSRFYDLLGESFTICSERALFPLNLSRSFSLFCSGALRDQFLLFLHMLSSLSSVLPMCVSWILDWRFVRDPLHVCGVLSLYFLYCFMCLLLLGFLLLPPNSGVLWALLGFLLFPFLCNSYKTALSLGLIRHTSFFTSSLRELSSCLKLDIFAFI